ncbi:MAG: alanine--glyoxylate aminotransferase family protein [Chloroflexi bacterium]|nr:alanine--glyoxylate aminotransferase family protein [Chloroflexota bacterium]
MPRFEQNLRIPGPTALPPGVMAAGGRQMINHRGPEFAALMERIVRRMRPFFGTDADILLLTAAGSGALEAAVVNVLSPGDRVLAVTVGAFGDRFAKVAEVYGADVRRLEIEWGQAATPAAVRGALLEEPDVRAVLLTHNETSTGITNPIRELAATIRELAPDALILVDAISALGAVPFAMDAWGLDLVVSGSQKAWMSAPGMAFAAVAERAWEAMETARMPRFYFDLRRARESAATGQTPWTPAVAVMYQVDEGLRLMEEETPEGVFARHAACAAATRAGLVALGFGLLAEPAHSSQTVTAAWIPDDLDWKAFNAELKRRGLVLAGGQGRLKGRIFRVGHLGSVELEQILGAVAVLEEASLRVGRAVEPGVAVAAAQRAALAALEVPGVAAGEPRPATAGAPA